MHFTFGKGISILYIFVCAIANKNNVTIVPIRYKEWKKERNKQRRKLRRQEAAKQATPQVDCLFNEDGKF